MVHLTDVSAQRVSWVKSNKDRLDELSLIQNLYYPESIDELVSLLRTLIKKGEEFDVIGHSSNTLFLPSYSVRNLVCTTKLNRWSINEDGIFCECGVAVAKLAKEMIELGFAGFEGLTDLPGTIAAGVYGNAGCRDCSVNSLVRYVTVMFYDGTVRNLEINDLALRYRSSAMKRGELKAVIVSVMLNKNYGNPSELVAKAEINHKYRLQHQPSGSNNLGTTFLPGGELTFKGKMLRRLILCLRHLPWLHDAKCAYKFLLTLTGNRRFVPYIYDWNRYMFLDSHAHDLFPKYEAFLKSLDAGIRLEIEVRS